MNKKRTILFIHHCDDWGGAGISLFYCCKMLMNDYKVIVCLPHNDSEVASEIRKLGVDIISFNDCVGMISAYSGGPKWYSRTFWKNLIKIRDSWKRLSIMVDSLNVDLIIANSITLSWISFFSKYRNIPFVCYIRETKVANIGFGLSRLLINRFADGALFISAFDCNCMRFSCKRQAVVEDVAVFKKYYENIFSIPRDKLVIAFLGGNESIKGCELVKKIVSMDLMEDFILVIAGNVNEEDRLDNENVKYVGMISDVGYVLQYSDILLFPATFPHQARPVFEAGAFQIPVIVTRFSELEENVIDEWNGLMFENCNVDDLIWKIEILKSDEKRKMMGINNEILFQQKHSFDSCKQRFAMFVGSLLS